MTSCLPPQRKGDTVAKVKTITVDGIEYIPRGAVMACNTDGLDYVIVRTYSAGVFAGWLESRVGKEVVLRQARRIWYWAGAASLSQLAIDGPGKPAECKFPAEVDSVTLTEAIEIIPTTEKAQEVIESVSVWKQ